jgi:MFS transporter, AAHS family, 4-hydroxybenzoate transporter
MSITQASFDVPTFINSRRVGAVQWGVIVLCALVMFLDGFDTQAISYMAPLIAKEWGFSGNYWDRFSRRRWPG